VGRRRRHLGVPVVLPDHGQHAARPALPRDVAARVDAVVRRGRGEHDRLPARADSATFSYFYANGPAKLYGAVIVASLVGIVFVQVIALLDRIALRNRRRT
jgi:hypothetical protein